VTQRPSGVEKNAAAVACLTKTSRAKTDSSSCFSSPYSMAQRLRNVPVPGRIAGALFWKGEHMNWDRARGNWKQFSGKVKEKWGKLTDDQLTQINGKREQLVGRVQEAYGISRDEADRQVSDWERTL